MGCENFKVIIAGGGIAGLTLANLLERVGIDYVILEAHRQIDPQVGASIGILPNGCRILDQIGLYEKIRSFIEKPLYHVSLRDAQGNETAQYDGLGEQFRLRYGYDIVFVDRQMILKALWENLKNKERVLVSKRVTQVLLEPNSVRVETSDGQCLSGDILVGADGVHSKVRNEMWRLADTIEPGYIPASENTDCLPTVYKCIFGISIWSDWGAQTTQTNLNKHYSYLVIDGPQDRVYWFLFINTGTTKTGPEPTRYTKEDEEALVNVHLDDKITKSTTFRDLYSTKISSVLTSLPEYVFKKWHFNRIMTIGDAAHKMEPISGQGGNSAIESAAVLVNNLVRVLKSHPSVVTTADIDAVFAETQKTREPRVSALVKASNEEQRFAAMESPLLTFLGRHIVPRLSVDDMEDQWFVNMECSHKIDFLDVPKRTRGSPFLDELPCPQWTSSVLPKIIVGTALCGVLYTAQKSMVVRYEASLSRGTYLGGFLKDDFTGIPQIDAVLAVLCWAFSQSVSGPDPNVVLQCIYFLINLIPVIYIWTVEGYRNGNHLSLVSWPSLFTVYQLFGIGKVAPVYFLVSLYTTRRKVYTRPTGRPIPSTVAKSLLPALCLGYILPTALMFLPYGDDVVQQKAIAFWQPSPIYVLVLTSGFSYILQRVSPTKSLDWEIFEQKDLLSLQVGYAFCFSATAVAHICTLVYARSSSSVSLYQTFFAVPTLTVARRGTDMVAFWKYDFLLCFGAVAIWCLYTVFELRRLGYVTTQAAIGAVAAVMAAEVVVGPGATYVGLWAWRENVIAALMKN